MFICLLFCALVAPQSSPRRVVALVAAMFASISLAAEASPSNSSSGFNFVYTFPAEECSKSTFYAQSKTGLDARSAFDASATSCLSLNVSNPSMLKGQSNEYPMAENGVDLSGDSQRVGKLTRLQLPIRDALNENFTGDVFAVAVWFRSKGKFSPQDVLFAFTNNTFRLTNRGVGIKIGEDLQLGQDAALPESYDETTLIVFNAAVRTGQLWRRSVSASAPVTAEFKFPEYYMPASQTTVVIPRMSSWPKDATAVVQFPGVVLYLGLYERNIDPAALFAAGAPEPKPICPSTRDVQVFSPKRSKKIDLSDLQDSIRANTSLPLRIRIASLPRFGSLFSGATLIDAHASTTSSWPFSRLSYIPYQNSLIKEDSFKFQAVREANNCASAYIATATLKVMPIIDPPEPLANSTALIKRTDLGNESQIVIDGVDPNFLVVANTTVAEAARVVLYWTKARLPGRLLWQNITNLPNKPWVNITDQAILFNGEYSLEMHNGTGWPIKLRYVADYNSPSLNRVDGLLIVGSNYLEFDLVNRYGVRSEVRGQITIDIENPSTVQLLQSSSSSLATATIATKEEQAVNITILNSRKVWLITSPKHGSIQSPSTGHSIEISKEMLNLDTLRYIPNDKYFGQDSIVVRVLNSDSDFVSAPFTIEFAVANVYDPSIARFENASLSVELYTRYSISVELINDDQDLYDVVVILEMDQSGAGAVAVRDLQSQGIQVVKGNACIDVGCDELIQFRGKPTAIRKALADLEYAVLLPMNNIVRIAVVDDFAASTATNRTRVYASITINYVGVTVWGTAANRGDKAVGAAIVGAVVAFLLIFAKGAWGVMPKTMRESIIRQVPNIKTMELPCVQQKIFHTGHGNYTTTNMSSRRGAGSAMWPMRRSNPTVSPIPVMTRNRLILNPPSVAKVDCSGGKLQKIDEQTCNEEYQCMAIV